MKHNLTKKLVRTALVAAIYATLTLILAPISYGAVQFRISEMLMLLAFINPLYITGLTLGCLIANILGGLGLLDIIFGTLATFLSAVVMYKTSKVIKSRNISLFIASLWPTIFNGLIVGWVIWVTSVDSSVPLFIIMLQVALGEFVVITIAGIPVFKLIEKTKLKEIL